ncbi:hypothetical protein MMC19_002365 [Ptychographa xylographoides]|nr:hypothetical protein [Ptychographa xylographoides]
MKSNKDAAGKLAVMYKNQNITDFFKPFAQPRSAKRPRHDSDADNALLETPQQHSSPTLPTPSKSFSPPRPPSLQPSTSSSLSFSSHSSDGPSRQVLDDVPTASASNSTSGRVTASSRRIVKDGEDMIGNSDDESSSDLSLEDLLDLIDPHREAAKSDHREPEPSSTSAGTQTLPARVARPERSTRSTRRDAAQAAPQLTKKPKFSLDFLVAQAEEDDAAEKETAQARRLVGSLDDKRAMLEAKLEQAKKKTEIDKEAVAVAVQMHGETDNISKLMEAIERTEALCTQRSWSFFEAQSSTIILQHPHSGPALLENVPQEFLGTDSDMQMPFVSGYLGEIAGKGRLPIEAIKAVLDASVTDSSDDLISAYISTLTRAGPQITPFITPAWVHSCFRELGATQDALSITHSIESEPQIPAEYLDTLAERVSLRYRMKLFAEAADWLSAESRVYVLCLLCRIVLDHSVIADRTILEAIEDAFESLIGSIPEEEVDQELKTVLSTTFPQIKDSQLQLQLLKSIPATSSRLSLLRRRFAMAFFYEDASYLQNQPPHLVDFQTIMHHLRTPSFSITKATDYPQLAARIALLDIGLDDGDPPDSWVTPELEAEFNKEIDSLGDAIRTMSGKITDTGASHMTRTEAKDGLEAFRSRLVYAVRTRSKPKINPFGISNGLGGIGVGSGDFMKKFLSDKKAAVLEVEAA